MGEGEGGAARQAGPKAVRGRFSLWNRMARLKPVIVSSSPHWHAFRYHPMSHSSWIPYTGHGALIASLKGGPSLSSARQLDFAHAPCELVALRHFHRQHPLSPPRPVPCGARRSVPVYSKATSLISTLQHSRKIRWCWTRLLVYHLSLTAKTQLYLWSCSS